MAGKSASILVRILGDAEGAKNAVKETESTFGGLADKLKIPAAAAGTAVAGALLKGLSDALGAQDVGASIAAQLGLDVDSKEAKEYGAAAGAAYRAGWGESLEEAGGVTAAIASSFDGLDGKAIEALTGNALALSQAFGVDAVDAIGTVSTLIGSGLVDSAEGGLDLLTRGLQEVPAALRGDLGDAVVEYAQFFKGLGFDAETTFGLLVAGAEDGMYGIDKTGDAIKEFGIRSTDMSALTQGVYETLGLDAEEMSNRLLAGGETAQGAFQEIVQGLLAIEDPTERANKAIALFGTPLEDLGTEQIPGFLKALSGGGEALGEIEGAATKVADTLGGTTSAKIEAFKRQALGKLADFVGQYLLPAFERAVQWFQTNWPQIQAVIERVMGRIREVVEVVVAIVQTIWDNFGSQITAVAEAVWGRIQVTVETAMNFIKGFLDLIMGIISGDWGKAWDGIKAMFGAVWDNLVNLVETAIKIIKAVLSAAWEVISSVLSSAWDGIKSTVSNALDAVVQFFTGLPGRIVNALGDLLSLLLQKGKDVVQGLWTGIGEAWDAGVEFLTNLPETLAGFFSDAGEWLLDAGEAIMGGLWDGIVAGAKAAGNIAGDIGSAVLDVFKDGWNAAAQGINDFLPNDIGFNTPFGRIGIDFPDNPIPTFHTGGIVGGPAGAERLILAQAGEGVFTPEQMAAMGNQGPAVRIDKVEINDTVDLDAFSTRLSFALQVAA